MKNKQLFLLLLSVVLLAACEKKNESSNDQTIEAIIQKVVNVSILAEDYGRDYDLSVHYIVFVFDSQVANKYGYSDKSKAITSGVDEYQSVVDGLNYHMVKFKDLSLSTSKTYDFVIYDNDGNVNGKASLNDISSYSYAYSPSEIDLYIIPYNY